MTALLTGDWHLTDHAEDEYRWEILETVRFICQRTGCRKLFVLGDLTERKDRHTGTLVNRLTEGFRRLLAAGVSVDVLLGNHDRPLSGTPYWLALNYAFGENSGLRVLATPKIIPGYLLLPWTATPTADWESLNMTSGRVILMHQTADGALGSNGVPLRGTVELPPFPARAKVYSGDVHVPQQRGQIVYVGAPHPIHYGDTYQGRLLLIDSRGSIKEEIRPLTIRKEIIAYEDLSSLLDAGLRPGDQVCIRARIPMSRLTSWPVEEQAMRAWAAEQGILVGWVDVAPEGAAASRQAGIIENPSVLAPDATLRAFAELEGVDAATLDRGLSLLAKTAAIGSS
jgi:hypothetical protein